MSQSDVLYLTANEVLRRFNSRKLSPVEYAKALIARAEAINPKLKAFTYTHFDEALDLAKKAEAKYAKSGARLRPLEGLPVGIKDESHIAGKPMSNGSLLLKDFVSETTSACNERILGAGAIVLARTATPEFSCASFTHSKLWGVTRNPWNPKFTPGGSSGGSTVALASGMAPLCTGSDIGGSLRIPASASGIVGFKPPYGRNPDDPPFNLDPYNHVGPLARSVGDCILLQNVMSGPSPGDIATVRPKITLPMTYRSIKGWKIAYSIDLGFYEVDREVAANMKRALDVFKSLGATIEEVDLGWTKASVAAGYDHLKHLFGVWISHYMKRKNDLCAYTIDIARKSKKSSADSFFAAKIEEARMYQTLGRVLEKYDVFICPTTALPAVKADFDVRKDVIRINNKESHTWRTLDWCMTVPFNSMSRCPVLAVPSGRASNNVPTGIQIVGRTFCDADVFRAATAYEAALGGWYRNPKDRPIP
jgi:amidase